MCEKEEEIINGLGKLYPDFNNVKYCDYNYDPYWKCIWVYMLCKYHLNQRIPSLEGFIETTCEYYWKWYKENFGME